MPFRTYTQARHVQSRDDDRREHMQSMRPASQGGGFQSGRPLRISIDPTGPAPPFGSSYLTPHTTLHADSAIDYSITGPGGETQRLNTFGGRISFRIGPGDTVRSPIVQTYVDVVPPSSRNAPQRYQANYEPDLPPYTIQEDENPDFPIQSTGAEAAASLPNPFQNTARPTSEPRPRPMSPPYSGRNSFPQMHETNRHGSATLSQNRPRSPPISSFASLSMNDMILEAGPRLSPPMERAQSLNDSENRRSGAYITEPTSRQGAHRREMHVLDRGTPNSVPTPSTSNMRHEREGRSNVSAPARNRDSVLYPDNDTHLPMDDLNAPLPPTNRNSVHLPALDTQMGDDHDSATTRTRDSILVPQSSYPSPETPSRNSVASPPRPAPVSPPAVNQTASPPPSSNQPSNLCEHCQVKPKCVEGTRIHPYCGRFCAAAAAAAQAQPGAQPRAQAQALQHLNCVICNIRPRYNDGTTTHLYCGRRCAASGYPSPVSSPPSAGPLCTIPRCQRPAFTDSMGKVTDFCSINHRNLALEACLACRNTPMSGYFSFCSKTCVNEAQRYAPLLITVPEGHVTFTNVLKQFNASWRQTTKPLPKVHLIYKIIMKQSSIDQYEAYRALVENRGSFLAQGRSVGNENRRWHGTRRHCNIGDPSQPNFCPDPSCPLCNIIMNSFDVGYFAQRTGWGRFGLGIYTSSTSSKSDDYQTNNLPSPLKAVLLNKVVVGQGYKLRHDRPTLTAPPPGFDSVLGERGGALNHDECVVYCNDAIRPSFLVMYA